MLTLVDNTSHIVNVSLDPTRKPLQILSGHEVGHWRECHRRERLIVWRGQWTVVHSFLEERTA